MINKFCVYSRCSIEGIIPHDVPHVIVSIRTPGDPNEVMLPTSSMTLRIVHLQFHDADSNSLSEHETISCFNASHARQILDVVSDCHEAQLLIVHCDAGLSRSPGVAAAISKILTGDDNFFFKRYHPNMLVYRTILEEHYKSETSTHSSIG